MSDPLEKLLKRTEEWVAPPGDPGAVKGRGKTLKVRRAVFSGLAGLMVVVVAGGTFLVARSARDDQDRSFVSTEDQTNSPAMRAKVARFAFHAVSQAGPYRLDYQSLQKTDEGWDALFVSGPPIEELERRLAIHEDGVEDFKNMATELREQIRAEREGKDRPSVLQALRKDRRFTLRSALPLAKEDRNEAIEALQEAVVEGGPFEVLVTVTTQDGRFHVTDLSGPYEGADRVVIEEYQEEIPPLPVGYEFYDVSVRQDRRLSWEGRGFYVGPVGLEDEVSCGLRVFDDEGALVAETDPRHFFEFHGERTEDDRDGSGLSAPLVRRGRTDSLLEGFSTETICEPFLRNQSSRVRGFDPLYMELELRSGSVPVGGKVGSLLHVRNDSGETVVDPACRLSAWRFGLVPADDPSGEIWQAVVVDCGDEFRMEPGFEDTFDGHDFSATTPTGEPLPPGEYLAVLEIEGRSERLTAPVTVTGE